MEPLRCANVNWIFSRRLNGPAGHQPIVDHFITIAVINVTKPRMVLAAGCAGLLVSKRGEEMLLISSREHRAPREPSRRRVTTLQIRIEPVELQQATVRHASDISEADGFAADKKEMTGDLQKTADATVIATGAIGGSVAGYAAGHFAQRLDGRR